MRLRALACAAVVAGCAGLSGCVSLPTAAWSAIAAGAGAAACPPLIAFEKDAFDWATGQTRAPSSSPSMPAK